MAGESWRANVATVPGALAGAFVYFLGIALLVAAQRFDFHPAGGIWTREFTGAEYVVVHAGAHLPVWDGTLHAEVLIYTLVSIGLLVLAGVLVARRVGFESDGTVRDGDPSDRQRAFRAGGSIALGYFPAVCFGSFYGVVALDAITAIQMIAPAVIVGGFYPVAFGGVGGRVALWFASR